MSSISSCSPMSIRSCSSTTSIASKRRPRRRPRPGRGSQKSRRSRPTSSRSRRAVSRPAAYAAVTSAPALDPETRVGTAPRASSTESMPVCAKNEKNPDDMVSANGSARKSARVSCAIGGELRTARALRRTRANRARFFKQRTRRGATSAFSTHPRGPQDRTGASAGRMQRWPRGPSLSATSTATSTR